MSSAFYLTILFLGVALAAPIFDSSFDAQWYKWKMKHGRTYYPVGIMQTVQRTPVRMILAIGAHDHSTGSRTQLFPRQSPIDIVCAHILSASSLQHGYQQCTAIPGHESSSSMATGPLGGLRLVSRGNKPCWFYASREKKNKGGPFGRRK